MINKVIFWGVAIGLFACAVCNILMVNDKLDRIEKETIELKEVLERIEVSNTINQWVKDNIDRRK